MGRSSMHRWIQRAAGAAVASALLVATVGAPAGAAAPPPSTTGFCANAPDGFGGFGDTGGNVHRDNIECLAFGDITLGKSAGRFAPRDAVTRAEMASFIARTIDLANELERVELRDLPADAPNRFSDDNGSVHEANINRLAAAGIVSGTTDGRYVPNEPVSRAQMATFINNAQRYLANGNAFSPGPDAFTDDNGNVHETNINAIANAGIAQGITATRYGPSLAVQRAAMASFLVRYLSLAHNVGAINPLPAQSTPPPPPPPPPTTPTNATITFTPIANERVIAAVEPSSDDDRRFTATGLQNRLYRVTLVQFETVTIDPGPVYTFTEDGSSGLADAGTVGARITEVNGIAVPPNQSVGGITPVAGRITITVDAESFGRLLPVIYTDEGSTNTRLNLNDQRRPREPFGVAGRLETIPQNASTGVLGVDAPVIFVDEAENLIVGIVGSSQRSFRYDDNDRYFLDSASIANEITQADFERFLNAGDRLDANTAYQATPSLQSVFILENVSPGPPTPRLTAVGTRTAVITIDDLIPGASANVYLGPDGAPFTSATAVAASSVDGNPGEPGFQIQLDDLAPATAYEYYVTQTVEQEESAPLYTLARAETSLITLSERRPAVTAAAVNGGRPGNQLLLDFSDPVILQPGSNTGVTVTCTSSGGIPGLPPPLGPGTTFSGRSTLVTQVDADTVVATLNGTVPAGGTCVAAVVANLVQGNNGFSNAAQNNIPVAP